MHLDLDIHNYYEKLMIEHLISHPEYSEFDKEFMADVCCHALTQLPARYIRHEIDMSFYLSSYDRLNMDYQVDKAVKSAIAYLHNKAQHRPNAAR
ncbi:late competence development ComFB family protein [Psychrobium sp. nBUS_13]|uniref:late competence development ComFB family protein n=1 Tax=Psychrobium sp. nBUS_13 TaxID=3395319 RepID=UPI003EBF38C3